MPCHRSSALVLARLLALLLPACNHVSALDGNSAYVRLDEVTLCVGRDFLEFSDLATLNEMRILPRETLRIRSIADDGAITGGEYRRGVQLTMFTEAASGWTPDKLKVAEAARFDKRRYPPDWVRMELLPRRPVKILTSPVETRLKSYLPESRNDFGFQSHRRNPHCVGKNVPLGALSAITLGPECAETELKYGNPIDPRIVLFCTPNRCYSQNPIEHRSVWFIYDFPRVFLEHWPTLHAAMLQHVSDWRGDQACVPKSDQAG